MLKQNRIARESVDARRGGPRVAVRTEVVGAERVDAYEHQTARRWCFTVSRTTERCRNEQQPDEPEQGVRLHRHGSIVAHASPTNGSAATEVTCCFNHADRLLLRSNGGRRISIIAPI